MVAGELPAGLGCTLVVGGMRGHVNAPALVAFTRALVAHESKRARAPPGSRALSPDMNGTVSRGVGGTVPPAYVVTSLYAQ